MILARKGASLGLFPVVCKPGEKSFDYVVSATSDVLTILIE